MYILCTYIIEHFAKLPLAYMPSNFAMCPTSMKHKKKKRKKSICRKFRQAKEISSIFCIICWAHVRLLSLSTLSHSTEIDALMQLLPINRAQSSIKQNVISYRSRVKLQTTICPGLLTIRNEFSNLSIMLIRYWKRGRRLVGEWCVLFSRKIPFSTWYGNPLERNKESETVAYLCIYFNVCF